MFGRIRSMFRAPEPAGAQELIRRFGQADQPIDSGSVQWADGAWRITAAEALTVRLYEIADPRVEQCMLAYRAKMKSEGLAKAAYLEMWCRLPGRGEFFSKGLQQPLRGTTGWASYEVPFYLKAGQCPDLIKLNVVLEGGGTVWLKEIELFKTPIKP